MEPRSKFVKAGSIAVIIGSVIATIVSYAAGNSVFPHALMALVFAVTEVVYRRRERRAE
ncbi:MAG: hypothetical protein RIB52_04035 [Erythrobacter sp.]|uniref:hypothetical protein n=1 Tax=Erythrobacter sp. TaxID=1042 RepID=UPI0032EAA7C5